MDSEGSKLMKPAVDCIPCRAAASYRRFFCNKWWDGTVGRETRQQTGRPTKCFLIPGMVKRISSFPKRENWL